MKKFTILMIIVTMALVSCKKNDKGSSEGVLRGTVTDAVTEQPISGANVVISPSTASSVTGSDGRFEFPLVEQQYTIKVTATGYASNTKQATVGGGLTTIADISLTPKVDVASLELSTNKLDFGASDDELSFTLTSHGNTPTIEWDISDLDASWVRVTPMSGETKSGEAISVKVEVLREKITGGKSISFMVNNSVGGSEPVEIVVSKNGYYFLADIPTDGSQIKEDVWRILDEGAPTFADFARLRSALHRAGRGITVVFEQISEIPAEAIMQSSSSVINPVSNLIAVEAPRVTLLNENAFSRCDALTTVDMPSVTSIGRTAFEMCYALTTVDMPSVKSIGQGAFSACLALTTVDFPLVTSIVDFAFASCESLTTFDFPLVTSIGFNAFGSCSSLTTVDFPLVTLIEEHAFLDCEALKTVKLGTELNSAISDIHGGAFNDSPTGSINLFLNSAESANVSGKTWRDWTFKSITIE